MPVETLMLKFKLLSVTTFGRGDGLPGQVDTEVEQDLYGLPFLRGRALRGLLAEEMESLLHALGVDRAQPQRDEKKKEWKDAGDRLLGVGGRMTDETGVMHVGDACLPDGVRRLVAVSMDERKLAPAEVLESLTAIRRQTAMTPFGAPEPASLRAMRVVLPGTLFEAQLTFDEPLQDFDKALLAATALAWRRAGAGRNRGRGSLRAWIQDDDWMRRHFDLFEQEVVR
jgi:hypothetical protein